MLPLPGSGARLCPRIARARLKLWDLQLHHFAESRLLERQRQIVAQIVALRRPAAAAALLAERIAEPEDLAENVAQIHGGRVETAAARSRQALVAVSIVGRALLRVRENAVGLRGLFELLFRRMIAWIAGPDDTASRACGEADFRSCSPAPQSDLPSTS